MVKEATEIFLRTLICLGAGVQSVEDLSVSNENEEAVEELRECIGLIQKLEEDFGVLGIAVLMKNQIPDTTPETSESGTTTDLSNEIPGGLDKQPNL